MQNLQQKSKDLRRMILELSYATRTAHLGSSLSCADILLAAYSGGLRISPAIADSPDRDRLVFSKGHCATALVCTLAQHGFVAFDDLLAMFNRDGGIQEHPNFRCVPGVENASGSLGHGLPIGVGMAIAARVLGKNYKVCVVMGDGESNEGSVWEAALLAAAQNLGNICVVVDFNQWQATGRSCEIMRLEPMVEKWQSFGWEAFACGGHNPQLLKEHLCNFGAGKKPVAIIANTVKGKGVSFMEDDNNWHYRIPNEEEMAAARKELEQ